jgi:hypothetical protein
MKFTAVELTEIRSAFRQRIATAPPKNAARAKSRPPGIPALETEPDYDDGDILSPGAVAEAFGVPTRTVRQWADGGLLPSFRRSADSAGSGGARFEQGPEAENPGSRNPRLLAAELVSRLPSWRRCVQR